MGQTCCADSKKGSEAEGGTDYPLHQFEMKGHNNSNAVGGSKYTNQNLAEMSNRGEETDKPTSGNIDDRIVLVRPMDKESISVNFYQKGRLLISKNARD